VLRISQTGVFIHAVDKTFFVEFLAFFWHVGPPLNAYRQVSFYAWVTFLKMSCNSSIEFPFKTMYKACSKKKTELLL
jgi:hypothetical protein